MPMPVGSKENLTSVSAENRPDLKDGWDRMGKKQRTELLEQLSSLKFENRDLDPPVHTLTGAQAAVVTIAVDPLQAERATQEQEKLGNISADALEKLALIASSRSSNLTSDSRTTSTLSGEGR